MSRISRKFTRLLLSAAVCVPYYQSNCTHADIKNIKGSDCHNPVCHETLQNLNLAMLGRKAKSSNSSSNVERTIDNENNSSITNHTLHENVIEEHCPVSISVLGISTWNLIHTLAEYVPESPSESEKLYYSQFINSLAMIYPCDLCRVCYVYV